jgi:hypothetical protein
MLASFLGVLPILTPPLCATVFIMCSKSNPLVVFALDLMFTYEGEHTIFGLLGQANLLIHSSVVGHLGYFHNLAIVNSVDSYMSNAHILF